MTDQPPFTTRLTTPTDRDIVITRRFNAPAQRVFAAWTQPEHVRHWYGTDELALVDCQIDLRPGGSYRYVLRDASGQEYVFAGEYREIVPPTRLVYTDRFEGMPGHEALVTLTLEEHAGITTLTSTSHYLSAAHRDAHLRSGMEQGMTATLERFAQHLATIEGESPMSDANEPYADQPTAPAADLQPLDRLVGTWDLSGDTSGTVRYEWMEGGFFLLQHVEFDHAGSRISGLEVIGHLRLYGQAPSAEIWSRFYGSTGETLDYVYELVDDTLTIWAGAKGSPAYYQGTFSEDGTTCTGGWVYPEGGYRSTMTKRLNG